MVFVILTDAFRSILSCPDKHTLLGNNVSCVFVKLSHKATLTTRETDIEPDVATEALLKRSTGCFLEDKLKSLTASNVTRLAFIF